MVYHSRVLVDAHQVGEVALDAQFGPSASILNQSFQEIAVRYDPTDTLFWCYMQQQGRPSYTYSLGAEIQQVQDWMEASDGGRLLAEQGQLRYFVCASRTPGIYNLGGDLRHFADCIRNTDLEAMRHYAETCVRMQYANSIAYDAPVITMALVQGDALGGGFEHALAFDVLVAERSARMGLPEVVFNLFPGMGAYSFLARRAGRKVAEDMILGGRIFTGEELFEMGIVDVLAEDGQGEARVIEYIAAHRTRFAAERAVYRARRRMSPVSLEELLDITHIWAETAMHLTDADVRKMERLADAQERRIARARPQIVG